MLDFNVKFVITSNNSVLHTQSASQIVIVTLVERNCVGRKKEGNYFLCYDIKMSFLKKLLCDPGAEPLKTFNWNYSFQLCKENKENLGKIGYLGAHTELVVETELEHGILDFLPILIFQAQTPSLCMYLDICCLPKLMSRFRQG